MNFKVTYLWVIAFIIWISCSFEKTQTYPFSPHSDPQEIVFTGQILDYNPDKFPETIRLWYRQFCCQENFSKAAFPDQEGRFQFKIENNIAQDYQFQFASKIFTFLTFPGDSIHFTLIPSEFAKNTSYQDAVNANEIDFYQFDISSNSELVNASLELIEFVESLNLNIDFQSLLMKEGVLDSLYRRTLFLEEYVQNKLDSFILANNIHDSLLIDWGNQYVKYAYKFRSFLNPFLMLLQVQMRNPKQRDSLITKMPYDPRDFDEGFKPVYHSAYINFLHHIEFPFVRKETARIRKFQIDSLYDDILKLRIEIIQVNFGESQSEYMLSRYLIWAMDRATYADIIGEYAEQFINTIQNPMLTKAVGEKYSVILGKTEIPNSVYANRINELPENIENPLQRILAEFEGKIIVLDFWATWCAPCLSEFKNSYPEFVLKFDPKDVTFVFLASDSPKNLWEKKVAELPFEGHHYLLNKNQESVMYHLFGVNGIPHHTLIDRDGKVVKEKAPRPGEELEELITALL